MNDAPHKSDPTRLLETLAVQLETARRAFVRGSAAYVAGNLVMGGLAWGTTGGGGWPIPAIAFLGNVFYALTTEWELRWHALWRREIPRLERQTGITLLSKAAAGPRDLARWMRWIAWGLALVWLLVLIAEIAASGLDFRILR